MMPTDGLPNQEAQRTSITRAMEALAAQNTKLSDDLQARAMEVDAVQARASDIKFVALPASGVVVVSSQMLERGVAYTAPLQWAFPGLIPPLCTGRARQRHRRPGATRAGAHLCSDLRHGSHKQP